jgi:bacterioferritin-associated ferredoxin
MYLCLCYAVSDKLVEELIAQNGAVSVRDLQKLCNAGKGCGSCLCDLKKFVHKRTCEKNTKPSDELSSFPNRPS